MSKEQQFLPMSRREMDARGWDELDVLVITGDAYVDHPAFGAAVIGRVLEADGWRVGIISQPDWADPESLTVMGRPRLFCGITAGNLDSMLSNYTAARRKRKEDSYTPGGVVGKRPNLASMVYTQLVKKVFPGVTTVLGGIEASMRRTVHYDYWQDKLRPSVLADSKADLLVYGMGERAIRETARRVNDGEALAGIPGTARFLGGKETNSLDLSACVVLPSFEECKTDKAKVRELTRLTEREQNPFSGRPLVQMHGARAVLIEPPAEPLSTEDMDRVYELPYVRAAHPSYKEKIPAYTMIKESVTVVRGCGGGCAFCGLGLHQGRFLTSRSEDSVVREVKELSNQPWFHGTVTDIGGPTANLYGCINGVCEACKTCKRSSCLYPAICPNLELDATAAIHLMRRVRELEKVKHVFVQSGIRMDVALRTPEYIRELAKYHVSGHLKVAPEHMHAEVLKKMRKPGPQCFLEFQKAFEKESRKAGKKQYLVPYFISNFPGSTEKEMKAVEQFVREEEWKLQQVQDFIPLPMTAAAATYYTGLDYETGKPVPVIRGLAERRTQMKQLRPHARRGKGKRNR
ncbi:YgiQ family radical SAM protein [Tichowtungia aerotolerans]|uniref:YgiQ family radical SAM protein n=1 Tax=Tichowtungia aerotolerans TaxID=2697043 RepID=A0A6P1M0E7_9BACT|nr:YgiQ family radical SAM protein [Tichowtungia aerotolerans]QHI68269.1 YgiQ family radical SAM protein [Tichowtungia aerotolerans]